MMGWDLIILQKRVGSCIQCCGPKCCPFGMAADSVGPVGRQGFPGLKTWKMAKFGAS